MDVLSPSEAKELAENYIAAIANAMYNGSATVEQKEALKKSFGFETVDSNYDDFQKTLLNDFGEKETIFKTIGLHIEKEQPKQTL